MQLPCRLLGKVPGRFGRTNRTQLALVEALRGADTRVFVVGDENQSIYRFRNAELEVFRAERERARARGTEMVRLGRSFRSTAGVLGAHTAPLQFLPANSTARLIAAIMLSGRAIPLPAISNAVP